VEQALDTFMVMQLSKRHKHMCTLHLLISPAHAMCYCSSAQWLAGLPEAKGYCGEVS
jgi:hypothetical protein